jgi:4-amino-4-deoxy-L-arabinose transferase-like glycosyltransferase
MTTLLIPPPERLAEPPAPAAPREDPPHPGPPSDPRWARPALLLLLAGTAALYLWGLGASGWANSFYSAAVQAGTKSWKAFFYGSSDAANFITVDKPPAALWVMEISARIFGVNAWSILVPQALEGVAAVAVLYAGIRRWFGVRAGLLAGAVLALTPVAAVMFRYNNPDALLVLLITAAAYALIRAIESGRTRWLILAGTLVGFGFLSKMLQAFLVVPPFALAYLIAAPTPLRRRLGQLLAAGGALLVSSLWWVVAVMAVPAASRPYIGGSQNNSLWNLIFGYNGFGRLTGNESGSVGGGGAGTGRWGPTGLLRLFNSQFGGEAAWLIPAAGVFLVAGLALTWRAARTDRTRAALILWGGWLVVTAAVFSLSKGIIHPYYEVALAPAIGALIGIGATAMWARRARWWARAVLAVALVVTVVTTYVLLGRVPTWLPWLRPLQLWLGLALAALVFAWTEVRGRLNLLVAGAALVVALSGTAAYTLATVAAPHTGAIPTSGPAGLVAAGPGGGARRAGGFNPGALGAAPSRRPVFGGGAGPGGGLAFGGPPPIGGARPAGGAGGLLNGSKPSAALVTALNSNAGRYTWVAATVGANQASGYQLSTGKPVMAIGGFNGTDPWPTLAQFETLVQQGRIHYFIGGGGGGGGFGGAGGSSTSNQITSWVQSHYAAQTVGGVTLYDLTSAGSPATA